MILIKYKMFMKGKRHIYEIFQKFEFFPNNILGVSREEIFSKCNAMSMIVDFNLNLMF